MQLKYSNEMKIKSFKLIFSAIIFVFLTSCASTYKPPPKQLIPSKAHIPLCVGAISEDDSPLEGFEIYVLGEIHKSNVFEKVVFPFHPGDPVQAILAISISNNFTPCRFENAIRGAIVGASFFTLLPLLKAHATLDFEMNSKLIIQDSIHKYNIKVHSDFYSNPFGSKINEEKVLRQAIKSCLDSLAENLIIEIVNSNIKLPSNQSLHMDGSQARRQ
jgi:hypothetical protein